MNEKMGEEHKEKSKEESGKGPVSFLVRERFF